MVVLLEESRIRPLLQWSELLPAMERALIDLSQGRIQQPVRTVLAIPEARGAFGLMPAVDGGMMGAKFVTVFPRNAGGPLPTHQALIQLFSAKTGEPIAVLDGRLITEMRTAATSALATRLLSHSGARSLAILGSGVQARAHLEVLRLVRNFEDVRVWSRTHANAIRFAGETGSHAAHTAEEAVRGADVIVTVTNSPEPILKGEWLSSSVHINAVGAVGASRRELDSDAMAGAAVVVESRPAALAESGDILLSNSEIYAELGELLSGAKPLPSTHRTVYKSLGVAAEDLAAAALVYHAALKSGQ